jgi:hypothetical protein
MKRSHAALLGLACLGFLVSASGCSRRSKTKLSDLFTIEETTPTVNTDLYQSSKSTIELYAMLPSGKELVAALPNAQDAVPTADKDVVFLREERELVSANLRTHAKLPPHCESAALTATRDGVVCGTSGQKPGQCLAFKVSFYDLRLKEKCKLDVEPSHGACAWPARPPDFVGMAPNGLIAMTQQNTTTGKDELYLVDCNGSKLVAERLRRGPPGFELIAWKGVPGAPELSPLP